MTERLRVTVYDGKYTVIQTDTGLRALRYDEEWRDLTGDGLVLALAQEVEELRQKLEAATSVTTELQRDMNGTLATLEEERGKQAFLWIGAPPELVDDLTTWVRFMESMGQAVHRPTLNAAREALAIVKATGRAS